MASNIEGKTIDISKVRLAITIEVDDYFPLGTELLISGVVSVVKHEVGDNQDGTVNVLHVVKPTTIEYKKINDGKTEKG